MNRADRNESDSAQKEPAADLENTANVPASQSLSIANSKKRPASTSMVGPDYMMSNPYGNPYGNVYSTNMGSYSGNPYSSPEQGTSYSTEAAPKHKKSRTNTPWTPAEEQKLQQLREAGGTWSEIGKAFPHRTEGSVKKHWYKDMHYAEFGNEESQALYNAIKEYESNKWKVIGQKLGKPAKACEQYAREHFGSRYDTNPNIRHYDHSSRHS